MGSEKENNEKENNEKGNEGKNGGKNKKVIFSAIQPSGAMTLGNYLGAIKNWVSLQKDYSCIFALADLHTITVRQNPELFRKNTIELYALLLACGVDPEKSIFFIQSHVTTHSELAWILNCYTQFGELSRMTQFKDKSKKYAENINAGLFTYPSLMAADILLYNADLIPVGEDQKQHVELTRNIAQRFNGIYGETFVMPQPFIPKSGAKIMSLQNPESKMSKSEANPNASILLMDEPDVIMKKFKRAVTDSNSEIKFMPGQKTGINNLMNIYAVVKNKTLEEVENEFKGKGYGEFKSAVAEAVIAEIEPIQKRLKDYIAETSYLEAKYRKSAEKAFELSNETLKKVKEKVGFIL